MVLTKMTVKRGAYTKIRKKKFDFLRHTGQMANYLNMGNSNFTYKQRSKEIKVMPNPFFENKKETIWQKLKSYLKKYA